MEERISFISGFTLTTIWTMPIYEMTMALVLGIIGGFGGLIGRLIYKKLEQWMNKE